MRASKEIRPKSVQFACVAYVVFGSSLFDLLGGRISTKVLLGIGLIVLLNIIVVMVKKRKTGR
ncbi:MAG: hypothetical protein JXO49_06590 [Deltaproteobacteria bacterium]|nr:hypothetical protein [Candidatus Anaeroferrophillus wilburensis]MBN2888995.1 hypothetical protein [Deltaproteobacteria bacterium]